MSANFIIITGANGVGKSTLGQNFSKKLQIPFINLDIRNKEIYKKEDKLSNFYLNLIQATFQKNK
ncbi:hypothetical protein E5V15_09705 (plasmid) [Campylobacter jejuni]|uniref:AAA family ATPase n=1 Tax=Campylobacter sp. US12a TaxID=2498116 RepID=UPI0010686962|nr:MULTISPECIES: AAA family ATPase [Campylobacter]QDQ36549.1 hypothetical protein E5V15_09705 [Campylobacter jejuni]TEY04124.1 hypothetical protein ELQ15_08665 [Campylobacter sp. US12a]